MGLGGIFNMGQKSVSTTAGVLEIPIEVTPSEESICSSLLWLAPWERSMPAR